MARTLPSHDRRVCMKSNTLSASRDLFLVVVSSRYAQGAMFNQLPECFRRAPQLAGAVPASEQERNNHPRAKVRHQSKIGTMTYLRTLTLSFPGGQTNVYLINENQVEFQRGDGTWRVLSAEDVEVHFALHTEVSKWLLNIRSRPIGKDRA